MYICICTVPASDTFNTVVFILEVVTLLHPTVEDRFVVIIRNSDTSTGTPLIVVLLVSVAVTFLLMILVLFAPGTSSVVNGRRLPCPMYSVLLQARIK